MTRNWWDEIRLGTEEGNDDLAVFVALTRSLDLLWMDDVEIARRSGLDLVRIARIVKCHEASGLLVRHPTRPDLLGEVESVRPLIRALASQARSRVA